MEGKNKPIKEKNNKLHRTIAENKKAKTERLRKENKGIEICGGCNKQKKDCNCGRPTDYKPEYCTEIVNYFERCQAEILVDVKFFQPNKNSTISTILNPLNEDETVDTGNVKEISQKLVMQRFPTFARYARSIGVSKMSLYEWAGVYPEFSDSMRQCNEIAESILLENGLQGTYNSQFAQFLLINNHGYKNKTEVDSKLSGSVEIKTLPDEIKNKIIERLATLD